MPKLNDIHSSYGKSFGIAIANAYSNVVLNATKLPKNTIIVANAHDKCSMIATDNYGDPIRLTYEIVVGNGIVDNNGALSIDIDNKTLHEDTNGQLSFDIASTIDNETIVERNGKLAIDARQIEKCSSTTIGVAKVDGISVMSDNGTLRANTTGIDRSNNATNIFGTIASSETVSASNGILSAIVENLDKSSYSTFGIAKVDNDTIVANNGIVSVSTNSFRMASDTHYGISKPDNSSIYKTIDNALKINYDALKAASNTSFGVVKSDGNTTIMTNGTLSIRNYSTMQQTLLDLGATLASLDNRLDSVGNLLDGVEIVEHGPRIFTFVCDGLASVDLIKPESYGELPENMPTQKITATFIVNTNCPFKISIEYIDNDSPAISLYETNYDDIDIYQGESGTTRTYQTTEGKNAKISFSWLCKNYRDTNSNNYSKKTRINIRASYANDASIWKEVKYSIVRFNSLYNSNMLNGWDDDEIFINDNTNTTTPIAFYKIQIGDNDSNVALGYSNTAIYKKYFVEDDTTTIVPNWIPSSISSGMKYYSIIDGSSYAFTENKPKIDLYISSDGITYNYYRSLSESDIASEKVKTKIEHFSDNNTGTEVDNVTLNFDNNGAITFSYNFN